MTSFAMKSMAGHRRGKLSPEEVHAIRTSPRASTELASEYGLTASMIGAVRQGRSYGYLPMPRHVTPARLRIDEFVNPLETLAICALRPTVGMGVLDRQEALDAAWEDKHGRLPHEAGYQGGKSQ